MHFALLDPILWTVYAPSDPACVVEPRFSVCMVEGSPKEVACHWVHEPLHSKNKGSLILLFLDQGSIIQNTVLYLINNTYNT